MKMRLKIMLLLSITLLVFALNYNGTSSVNASVEGSPELLETINVNVNCTTATVITNSMITSSNTSFIHAPPGLDMNETKLENITTIGIEVSTVQSLLVYVFNNTDAVTARTITDNVTSSIADAFNITSFTWNSTGTSNTYVNITYTGPGKENLTAYTEWLMSQCLASDLEGFSSTFLPMTSKPTAFVGVSAFKESGSFNWTYSMMTQYSTNIPTGSDNHLIDILNLLNVSSLAPSPYANAGGMYTSMVNLQVLSNETVSCVSCQPGLANPPSQPKGWYPNPSQPPNTLIYYFTFANDPTPVETLTFTFGGTVIPEFTTLTLTIALLLTAIATTALKQLKA